MCSFPYTAAVKTVQALWPKLFFSSKKIFIPFVQSDRQQRFCAAFLQFLRYFKSAVQLHLPCPVAVFESGGWRMITSSASVPVSPWWSPPPPPSSPGDAFEERMSPGTDCLTSGGPELGTATIRTLRREPQQDGPGTTHTRFSGCVPAEKCRTGWKCGNRKKCHNGNYLTGTWIPHELLGSDVNLSTGCQYLCEQASTCQE